MSIPRLWSAALAFSLATVTASAEFLAVSGDLYGFATADDGDVETSTQSVGVGLGGIQPRQITPAAASSLLGDGQTNVNHSASATVLGLQLSGASVSADNGSDPETRGRMNALLTLTVDEAELYELSLNLTKDNDPEEAAEVTLIGSDSTIAVFEYKGTGTGQNGDATESAQFVLLPGVTYTLSTLFESSAGGNLGSPQSQTTYSLTLGVVPEPGVGLLLTAGLLILVRRRLGSS